MCIIAFFVVESLILNTVVIVFLFGVRSMISDIINSPGDNIFDKLASNPMYQEFVAYGKEGGFKKIVDHTVGRLYVEHNCGAYFLKKTPEFSRQSNKSNINENLLPSISRISVDVSNSGEAVYIMQRIQMKYAEFNKLPWSPLVVDIGANDGFMSSNSFNFIQCGWSALLVEPQQYQIDLARRNLHG